MPTPAEAPTVHGRTGAWSLHHTGVVVRDLDEAIAQYGRAFGLEVDFLVRDMDDQFQRTVGVLGVVCDLAQLTAPFTGTRIELIEVRGVPAGLPAWMPVHVGVGHTAYQVRDLDASSAVLADDGWRPLGELVEFEEGRAGYFVSRAGTVIELEEAWM